MTKTTILTFCGSLRTDSVNAATMRAAVAAAPADVAFEVIDIADVPLYNGDVEAEGLPAAVVGLHRALEASDALMIFTPEYNGSFPAVTKNVIDWLSRPPKPWENKGLTMVVTTPGPRAGESVRGHFDAVMGYFPVKHYPALGIGSYADKLDDDGEISDPATIAELRQFTADFAAACIAEAEKD